MAGPPPAKPVLQGPPQPTTVVSIVAGKKVMTTARSVTSSSKRPTFTSEMVADKSLMTKVLNDLVDWIEHQTEPASASPLLSACLLQGITFTAGQTQYLKHNLGRPFKNFVAVDALTADWSGRRVALATGLSASTHIGIRSTNAGTYSFLVF
jgi:hypothetical protein